MSKVKSQTKYDITHLFITQNGIGGYIMNDDAKIKFLAIADQRDFTLTLSLTHCAFIYL